MIRFGSRARTAPDPAAVAELAAADAQMTRVDAKKARHVRALDRVLGIRSWAGPAVEPYMVYRVRFVEAMREVELPDKLIAAGATLQAQHTEAWNRRWEARKAVGFDPRTGAPPVRERPQNRASGVESGHYPDLLEPTEDLRRGCDPEIVSDDGQIVHTSCYNGQFHHLRLLDDGHAVAGLTLSASRPWRGQQVAKIDRVYTDSDHRRQGHAQALLEAARSYFRRVEHSVDLTDDGKRWKTAMQGRPRR